MAPEPRPRPRTGGSKREHILEHGNARVHGDCRRPAVETKPADELLRPVGCAEDAGCNDLLPARPLARLLASSTSRSMRAVIGRGRLRPTERSGQEGSGVSGSYSSWRRHHS